MKLSDVNVPIVLSERVTSVVYHYTNLQNAKKILTSGHFELSVETNDSDKFQPEGYFYFFSLTRTTTGAYHSPDMKTPAYYGEVMFDLNGDWFNSRYKSQPVDYWNSPNKSHSEAEDRVFSKTDTMPLDSVTSIHILIRPQPPEDATEDDKSTYYKLQRELRSMSDLARGRDIPVYAYDDRKLWLLQAPKGHIDISKSYHRLGGLWELISKPKDDPSFSKEARSMIYELDRTYYRSDYIRSLQADLHNEKKQGDNRQTVVKIFNFMRDNKIRDIAGLYDFLHRKFYPEDFQDIDSQ